MIENEKIRLCVPQLFLDISSNTLLVLPHKLLYSDFIYVEIYTFT